MKSASARGGACVEDAVESDDSLLAETLEVDTPLSLMRSWTPRSLQLGETLASSQPRS